jgi:hypothetical protein
MSNEGEQRLFAGLVGNLEDGQLANDLGDALHRLNLQILKQAEAVGKAKSEITLKLKLSADSGGTVQIDADFKVKEPQPVRARSVHWLSKEGHLCTSNPKQTKLPLREVPRAPAAKQPGQATGE